MAVSTINKTGQDYDTLTIWEDAKDGVLTEIETAELYVEDGALDDRVTIDGSTTTLSFYMKITVPTADRHEGIWSNSKSRIVPTSDGDVILDYDNYTVTEWLQIYPLGSSANSGGYYSSGRASPTIHHCIIDGHDAAYMGDGIGIINDTNGKIYRNIVYGGSVDDPEYPIGIYHNSGGAGCKIINNTVFDFYNGIKEASVAEANAADIINNAVFNCGDCFKKVFYYGTGSGYNATNDAEAAGSNNQLNLTTADQFVNIGAGTENFHLKTGADCINNGNDEGSPYDVDIDGDTI